MDRVLKREGKTFVVRDGKTDELQKNISLPGDIQMTTNGTFQVKQGKERILQEGQVLSRDGTLTSADGTAMPVSDHITMKNGRVILVKEGEPAPLAAEVKLGDGSRISPDGWLYFPNGSRSRLLDGQIFKLDGTAMPGIDTVTLQGGKVFVQKDGSLLPVPSGRSMMMSDGTKVLGDGTVVKNDGSTVKLSEGQIITLEGVRRQ